MFLNIQLILVPQGAEHRAVCNGLRRHLNPPTVFPIPVGELAVIAYLTQLHQAGCLPPGHQVLIMGLCGGLSPDLVVGDGVLYKTCTRSSNPAGTPLECDRELFVAIQKALNNSLRDVAAVTSDRVISRAIDKQQLAQQVSADVVDMEGFATLRLLQEFGLSVAMLRVVSDDCQHDIPNLAQAFDANGSLKPGALAMAMIKQPSAALRLIQGSMHSLKILQSLTTELLKE